MPVFVAWWLVGCDGGSEPIPPREATIARVADGDTLVLEGGARVRLLQLDASEMGSAECYAGDATRELARLVRPGVDVELESDRELDRVDRHGRLLRYVHGDGENVNVELVRLGAAAPFFLRGKRGRYADDLLSAVEEARSARRGMWGTCRVVWSPEQAVETRPR